MPVATLFLAAVNTCADSTGAEPEPGTPQAGEVVREEDVSAEEYAKVSGYDDLLTDFRMEPAPEAGTFFGLGFYGLSCPRWGGNRRVTLDQLARHGVNFMGASSGRFYQNVWNDHRSVVPGSAEAELPTGEDARATVYVRTHRYLASVLREYGMHYLGNLAGFAGGVESIALTDRDREQMDEWADEIAALENEPNLLGWFCRDEAGPAYLQSFLVTKAMMESRVRSKPAMVRVNNLDIFKVFNDSHQIILTGRNPVLRPARDDPWMILQWMKEFDEVSGGKPHWFVSEASCRRREPWHARPGVSDIRLMSWLAVAGGAKVNCHLQLSGGPWWEDIYIRKEERGDAMWCMLDCYGNETPRYRVFREYAAKVAPLGRLLAKARPADRSRATAVAPDIVQNGVGPEATKAIPAVHIAALDLDRINGQILIAVNMDRDEPQPLVIKISDPGRDRLYDLVSLAEVPSRGSGRYEPFSLIEGDGHPFLLCDSGIFGQVRTMVVEAHAKQALRVAGLDLRMARAWGLDTEGLETKRQKAEGSLDPELIHEIRTGVRYALDSDQDYRECEGVIDGCKKSLGRMEVMMNIAAHGENPRQARTLDELAQELLAASETFDQAMEDLYHGKKEGLFARVKELREKTIVLEPRVSKATGAEPGIWPFPEEPWLQVGK